MPSRVELDILSQEAEVPSAEEDAAAVGEDAAATGEDAAGHHAPSISQWYLLKLLFGLEPRYLAYAVAAGFVLLAAVGSVSGWWLFYSPEKDKAFQARLRGPVVAQVYRPAVPVKPPEPVYTLEMPDFVLPLSDDAGAAILEVSVIFDTAKEAVKDELEAKKVNIRDQIIQVFKSQRVSDLKKFSHIERVRSELTMKINALLQTGEVQRIRFSKFYIRQ